MTMVHEGTLSSRRKQKLAFVTIAGNLTSKIFHGFEKDWTLSLRRWKSPSEKFHLVHVCHMMTCFRVEKELSSRVTRGLELGKGQWGSKRVRIFFCFNIWILSKYKITHLVQWSTLYTIENRRRYIIWPILNAHVSKFKNSVNWSLIWSVNFEGFYCLHNDCLHKLQK